MKMIATTSFNINMPLKLKELVLKNRKEYIEFQGYGKNKEIYFPKNNVDDSWRHPLIIYNTLKNKKFRDYDVIINTGQRNIVTNYNVDVLDRMMCHLNPTKHEMVLQSWYLNPDFISLIPYSDSPYGKIKLKKIYEPFLILTAE